MGATVIPSRRLVGAAIGLGLDRAFGEPPTRWHPLVYFGTLMGAIEERLYRDERAAGVGYAGAGLALGLFAGRLVNSTALATALSVGGRSLASSASSVASPLEAGDHEAARARLTALVGRDTGDLDEAEVARAVVESLAENTVDAIVAPALFAAVLGARGTLGYRAINTMDAMVGHRSARYRHFGTAAARLDDVANWVPARVTAALVAMVRPRCARAVLHAGASRRRPTPPRTPGSPRPPSPRPSGSPSAGAMSTATASRSDPRSVRVARRAPATSRPRADSVAT